MNEPTRRGRRPGDPEVTKRAILDAARAAFAESGYDGATIRAIAARAGVDPALIHHHFGSKDELFVVAHELPISPAAMIAALEQGDGSLGERVARTFLAATFTAGGPYEALVRSAMTHETARRMMRDFIEHAVLDALAPRLEVADARLRIMLVGSHLMGLFMLRRVIGVETLQNIDLDELVQIVAPTIERYLTADLSALN
jgi:AcrR family transcriptional regulator